MHITDGELQRRFDYHPPVESGKKEAHEAVRDACLDVAKELVVLTGPPSREQSIAITKLEEAMFWANAAIARPQV